MKPNCKRVKKCKILENYLRGKVILLTFASLFRNRDVAQPG